MRISILIVPLTLAVVATALLVSKPSATVSTAISKGFPTYEPKRARQVSAQPSQLDPKGSPHVFALGRVLNADQLKGPSGDKHGGSYLGANNQALTWSVGGVVTTAEFVVSEKEPGQDWIQTPTHDRDGPRGSVKPGWLEAELAAGRDGTAHFEQATRGDKMFSSHESLYFDFGRPRVGEYGRSTHKPQLSWQQ